MNENPPSAIFYNDEARRAYYQKQMTKFVKKAILYRVGITAALAVGAYLINKKLDAGENEA